MNPIITISPSLFSSPNEINIIAVPGTEFAKIIGVSVMAAKKNIIMPIILSATIEFIKVNLLLVNLSSLYK